MINKKIIKAFIIVFALMAFIGCGYTEEEKALMKSYEETSRINAVEYIESKYGFTPEITGVRLLKAESSPVPDFTPPATGMVIVSMRHDGVEFDVRITGEEYSTEGKDTYQKGEILQAFKDRLSKDLSINIETIDVRYSQDCLISYKYKDIDSLLENDLASIVIKTLDDISEKKVGALELPNTDLLVVSCRNKAGLDIVSNFEYLNEQKYRMNFNNIDAMDNKLGEYSLFMKGHVYRGAFGELHSKFYDVQKVDDTIFISYDNSESSNGVKLSKTGDMAVEQGYKAAGETYSVEFGQLTRMQVYIKPDGKIKTSTGEKFIGLQYKDEDGKKVVTHIAPVHVEGAYSFKIENHDDMKIAVIERK